MNDRLLNKCNELQKEITQLDAFDSYLNDKSMSILLKSFGCQSEELVDHFKEIEEEVLNFIRTKTSDRLSELKDEYEKL